MAGNHNSGRRPDPERAKQRAKNSLAQLSRDSLRVIKAAINANDVVTARWQQEMVEGRPRQRLEHAGDSESPVLVDIAGLPSEVIERIADMGRQIETLIAQGKAAAPPLYRKEGPGEASPE